MQPLARDPSPLAALFPGGLSTPGTDRVAGRDARCESAAETSRSGGFVRFRVGPPPPGIDCGPGVAATIVFIEPVN